MDVDDGQTQGQPGDFALGGARRGAGAQGDIGAGAAHVEGHDLRLVLIAGKLGQAKRADDAAGRPAEHEARRFLRGLRRADRAAIGLHHTDVQFGKGIGQVFQVAAHQRQQVGVDDGRGGALILAIFGQNVAAERDGQTRAGAAQNLGGAPFMLRIAKTVEKADGQALRRGRGDLRRGAREGLLVQGRQDVAGGVEAFHGRESQVSRGQWMWTPLVQGVEMGPVLAANFDDIDETGGGQQGRARAAPLQQRVGGDGRAMHQFNVNCCVCAGRYRNAQACQPGQNRPALVGWRRRLLMHAQPAIFQQHKIGECSADINSDQGRGHGRSS